jgi:uncharacterized membrane protein YraQ (UPF0718 family)
MKDYIKKHLFELSTFLFCIILFFFYPAKTLAAVEEGFILLLKMLPMFLCVVFFSSFLALFLSPKTIQKYLGKESGFWGIVLAAILGTVIVGPLWILFPLFEMLLKKGARISVVGAIVGAFAIKTPWIPYAISFLGAKFVLISVVLILAYAVVEGLLMEKILLKMNYQPK